MFKSHLKSSHILTRCHTCHGVTWSLRNVHRWKFMIQMSWLVLLPGFQEKQKIPSRRSAPFQHLPTSSNSVWAPGPWSLGEKFRKFAGDVLVLEAHQHVGGRAAPIPHGPFQGLQQGEGPEKSENIMGRYGKVGWIMYAGRRGCLVVAYTVF